MEDILRELQQGNFIIIVDEHREQEADLVIAAEHVTPDKIAFMLRFTSGIITVPLTAQRAEELQLPLMVHNNTDKFKTNFTISVDAKHPSMRTGISCIDRSFTIQKLVSGNAEDFSRPGHIFPLIAQTIQERQGHTEAAVTMCQLAGLQEIAAIAELMNSNGMPMNKEEIYSFAQEHKIKMINIEELVNSINLSQ